MKPLRLHILGLPNAPVHPDYSLDGFAQVGHRFCRMMKDLGHTVFLYGAAGSNAPCDEMVEIISEKRRLDLLGVTQYQYTPIDGRNRLFKHGNSRAIDEIAWRRQPGDFLLTIGGLAQSPIFDALPDLIPVEYSIGYHGNFAKHRVFESCAWMHHCYGAQGIDGRFSDTVIPCFYDPEEFHYRHWNERMDFLLYVGRLTPRKGIEIACRAAEAAAIPLKVIGHGDTSLVTHGAEYLGALSTLKRNDWLSRARAVLCPTTYVEPFNQVAVEAQLCGTPVISTSWGGFTETVEHGRTGFRCSSLEEFVRAIDDVKKLDPAYIRGRACDRYSMRVLKYHYERYFRRIAA